MKIYKDGVIRSIRNGVYGAIAIEGEYIAAVGELDDVRRVTGPCEEVSLNGKCLLPGFIDSHCHTQLTGVQSRRLDMRGVRSVPEMIERGRNYIREHNIPEGTWIVSDGFDQNLFDIPELPVKQVADAITDKHPLLLERICGHVGTLNTMGLEMVGYTGETVIEGGSVDIGPDGMPNGILRENALYRVTFSLPKATDAEGVAELLAEGMRRMNRFGVTSAHSDDLEGISVDLLDEAVTILRSTGRMTVRLFEELLTPEQQDLEAFIAHGCRTGAGDEYYRYGNIKLILDGSLGARTAYMRENYPGTADRGMNVYTDRQIEEFVLKSNANGLQVAGHCIGDAAAEQLIRAAEISAKINGTALRNRIVHGQFMGDNQIRRAAAINMGVDAQPQFVATDWRPAENTLSPEQQAIGYRWKTMLNAGILTGGGSDSPVVECDPIEGIYCAVTRMDESETPENGWHPDECLTVQQALEMYTINAAKLSFEDDIKGELAPGMLADLVILSEDPFDIEPKEIRNIRVLETIVGGKTVYRAR